MTAFAATLRYELLMQLRKPTVWIATLAPFALYTALILFGLERGGLDQIRHDTDPKVWMILVLGSFTSPLTIVSGMVLADRLARDRKLRVSPVLDVTPASRTARLAGKHLGACAATAVPPLLIYLAVSVGFAVWRSRPGALFWGPMTYLLMLLPALLVAGALALLGPQVMPVPLFRVLFVGLWLWCTVPAEKRTGVPSIAGTVLSLTLEYPQKVFFGMTQGSTGPVDGVLLNVLRPTATPGTALLSIGLIVGLTVAILAAARALRARTTD